MIGANIKCLFHWHLYGPHTYLVARLLWDAEGDVDAIMDDFYTSFCGNAAPYVKAYWERIDKAYAQTDIHVGSFYGIHVVWTPELVNACREDLAQAAQAVKGRNTVAALIDHSHISELALGGIIEPVMVCSAPGNP